jgi:hypothetical protein
MQITEALDALAAALDAAEVPRWSPPQTLTALEELEAELFPLRLPDDVREFWSRVDARTLRAEPFPRLTTPEFALDSWREVRAGYTALLPLALVPVAYESHGCMTVELDVGDVPGGTLFESVISEPTGFARRFDSLADWLAHVADLIERGACRRLEGRHGVCLCVPDPLVPDAERPVPPLPGRHPVHGDRLHVGVDVVDWPEHWHRAARLHARDAGRRDRARVATPRTRA